MSAKTQQQQVPRSLESNCSIVHTHSLEGVPGFDRSNASPNAYKSDMSTSWPQETVWPIRLHEHATKLTKYLRDVLLYLDREHDKPVPPDRAKKLAMAGLSLVVKVQGTPDMATVHDEMRTIHTELNQNAESTARELASIKEELRNNKNQAYNRASQSGKRQRPRQRRRRRWAR
jgi:hypothetical protein